MYFPDACLWVYRGCYTGSAGSALHFSLSTEVIIRCCHRHLSGDVQCISHFCPVCADLYCLVLLSILFSCKYNIFNIILLFIKSRCVIRIFVCLCKGGAASLTVMYTTDLE